jgi:hypothetical protein
MNLNDRLPFSPPAVNQPQLVHAQPSEAIWPFDEED